VLPIGDGSLSIPSLALVAFLHHEADTSYRSVRRISRAARRQKASAAAAARSRARLHASRKDGARARSPPALLAFKELPH